MIDSLINLACHLDSQGLIAEANFIDKVIERSRTKVAKKVDDREISEMTPEEAFAVGMEAAKMTSKEEKGSSEDGKKEQVEFADHETENFDMCPGAVEAFEMLSGMHEEHEDSTSSVSGDTYEELVLGAMGATDDLLAVERGVLDGKSATIEQLDEVLALARTVSHYIGILSEVTSKQLGSDFEFLDMHIKAVAELLGSPESNLEDAESD